MPDSCEIYALSNHGLIVPDAKTIVGKGHRESRQRDNFPQVLSSFLGRKKELEEICNLLREHRIITLTGPGGTGKTRLSIQIARDVRQQFKDGIYWIPLAGVRDLDALITTIAKQLNLQDDAIHSVEEVLIDFFRDQRALLVLDNFEQIIGAASSLIPLILQCSSLHIITTSRIPLQISGEVEYQVPPLRVPTPKDANTLAQLEQMPSIALFAQRAKTSRNNFELTPENIASVAEICIRLDGLPLAIELAAARIKIFTPKALLDRLKNTFSVLKGGDQFPERHRTLRQTIAWSYDLLEQEEQRLFRRFSILVGSCTLESIENICGLDTTSDWYILDGVMAMVTQSLVKTDDSGENIRFFMLETIREFALEEIEKTEEVAAIKKAHITFYLALAEEASPHFYSAEAESRDESIFNDIDNLRAALDYAIELKEMALGYRMGLALIPFWSFRGMTANEGVQQLEKLTAIPVPESLSVERLKILQTLARFYGYTPFRDKAEAIFEECLAYWRDQDDENQIGLVLNDFGWYHIEGASEYNKSDLYSSEAREIFERSLNTSRLVASLNNLGMSKMFRSRPREALPIFQKTTQLTIQLKDKRRNAQALLNTAYCNYLLGDYETAEKQLNTSLITFRKNSSRILEEFALIILCFIFYEYQKYSKCKELSDDIKKIAEEIHTSFAIGLAYKCRASAEYGLGNLADAKSYIEKAVYIFENISKSEGWIKNRAAIVQAKIAWKLEDFDTFRSCCHKLLTNELEQGNYSGFISGLELTARLAAHGNDYLSAAILFFNAQTIRAELKTPIRKSEEKIFVDLTNEFTKKLGDQTYQFAHDQHLTHLQLKNMATDILVTGDSKKL